MNIDELRAFAGEYLGKEVEYETVIHGFRVGVLDEISISGKPFHIKDYGWSNNARPPQPKQMRPMTAQELAGKWLVHEAEEHYFIVNRITKGEIFFDNKEFISVSFLIEFGWKVNDKPSMDGATELRVEVSE